MHSCVVVVAATNTIHRSYLIYIIPCYCILLLVVVLISIIFYRLFQALRSQ